MAQAAKNMRLLLPTALWNADSPIPHSISCVAGLPPQAEDPDAHLRLLQQHALPLRELDRAACAAEASRAETRGGTVWTGGEDGGIVVWQMQESVASPSESYPSAELQEPSSRHGPPLLRPIALLCGHHVGISALVPCSSSSGAEASPQLGSAGSTSSSTSSSRSSGVAGSELRDPGTTSPGASSTSISGGSSKAAGSTLNWPSSAQKAIPGAASISAAQTGFLEGGWGPPSAQGRQPQRPQQQFQPALQERDPRLRAEGAGLAGAGPGQEGRAGQQVLDRLVSVCWQGTMCLWDGRTRKCRRRRRLPPWVGVPISAQALPHDPSLLCIAANEVAAVAASGTHGRSSAPAGPSSSRNSFDQSSTASSAGSRDSSDGEGRHSEHDAHPHGFLASASAPSLGSPPHSRGRASAPRESTGAPPGTENWAHAHGASVGGRLESKMGTVAARHRPSEGFKLSVVLVHAATLNLMQVVEQGLAGQCPVAAMRVCLADPGTQFLQQLQREQPGGLYGSPGAAAPPNGEACFSLVLCNWQGEVRTWPSLHMSEQKQHQHRHHHHHQHPQQQRHSEGHDVPRPHSQQNGTARRATRDDRQAEAPGSHAQRKHLHGHSAPLVCNLPLLEQYSQMRAGLALGPVNGGTPYPISVSVGPTGDLFLVVFTSHFVLLAASGAVLATGGPDRSAQAAAGAVVRSTFTPPGAEESGDKRQGRQDEATPRLEGGFLSSMRAALQGGMFLAAPVSGNSIEASSSEQSPTSSVLFLLWNAEGAALVYQLRLDGTSLAAPASPGAEDGHFSASIGVDAPSPGAASFPWMHLLSLISVIPPAAADSSHATVSPTESPASEKLEGNTHPLEAGNTPSKQLHARAEESGESIPGEASASYHFWQMAEASNSILIGRATSSSAEAEKLRPGQWAPPSLHVWRCPLPPPPADSSSSSAGPGPQSAGLSPTLARGLNGSSALWWLPPPGRLWDSKSTGVAQLAAQASLGDAWNSSAEARRGAAGDSQGAAGADTAKLPGGGEPMQRAAPGDKPAGEEGPAAECTCAPTHACLVGSAEGGLGPGLLARAHACGNIEALPLLDVGPRWPLHLSDEPQTSKGPIPTPPTHVWLRGHEGAVTCLAEHAMPALIRIPASGRGGRVAGALPSQFPKEVSGGASASESAEADEKVDAAVWLRRVLISGGSDWAVRVWDLADLANAEVPVQLPGRQAEVLVGDEPAEAGGCGAQLGPKSVRRPLAVLRHHVAPVRQIVLPPAAAAAISAQFSPLGLQSPSATSSRASASATPGQGPSTPATLPPWLYCFLTLSEDGSIAVCSLLTLRCERLLPGHPSVPRDVLWDAARGYIAALCRPHPMAVPPPATSAPAGHMATAIPSSTYSSAASLAPSGPPSPSAQTPPQQHQAARMVPGQQGSQRQPSGAGRKLRGRRRSSGQSSMSLSNPARASGIMGVLQERALSVGNSGPGDAARDTSATCSAEKRIFELSRRESEESLEALSPRSGLEKDPNGIEPGSAGPAHSRRGSEAASPAAEEEGEDSESTAGDRPTWPSAWEKVREFSSSSPMDVLFVWDVHSGARERYLRAAPAHSLYSFFHIRMRNAAAQPPSAGQKEPQSPTAPSAWAGHLPSPFALEDIVWSDATDSRGGGDSSSAAATSESSGGLAAVEARDTASNQQQGQTPGVPQTDGSAEGDASLGTLGTPNAAVRSPGDAGEAAEPALGRSPVRVSPVIVAGGQGPVGYKVRVGDIGGTPSATAEGGQADEGVCIVGSKTIVVTPFQERPIRGPHQPNADKTQGDREPEPAAPGLQAGPALRRLPSSTVLSGRFLSVPAVPAPVPAIRGQCVLPSVAALTVDALHLLSHHWGPPRVYPALGMRQHGQQQQQHPQLSPAELRAIEAIADAAADAALPPTSAGEGLPRNPLPGTLKGAQNRAVTPSDGTSQQVLESGGSLSSEEARCGAVGPVPSSPDPAVGLGSGDERRERERLHAHVRQDVLQQLLHLQGSQARALRNSLRLLCCWALHPDLESELDALLGLRLPHRTLLGPGLLGDKGALTFAVPGSAACAEMIRSSAEFSALRSLAIVSTAQRLAQLLPHPLPLAPTEPPPDAGADSTLRPTAPVAFSPPSVRTTCQRLATYYSNHLLDKIGGSAPPSLEIFACFWQDSVPQVRAAARLLFHYSAARAFPPELLSPVLEAPATTRRTGAQLAPQPLVTPAKAKQPGSSGLFPNWGGRDGADISRWVESEDGYELVSAVGGTVYDARSARTNVAAALAVWYLPPGRNDLAAAVAPSLLSLVRAASSRHSATAAEILAEGMTATWQPLIGPQIPRLIADVFLLCEALQGSWADAASSASWGSLAPGSGWAGAAGAAGARESAGDAGAGAGRQWMSPQLSAEARSLRLVSPSMAHHSSSQMQRSPSDMGAFALDPGSGDAALRSLLSSPGSQMPHFANGASYAPTPPQARAGSGAPRPGSPDAAQQSSVAWGWGGELADQFQQAGAGDWGSAPAAGVAVVVKETLAAVLLPALAMADFHAFLSAVQNLQSSPASFMPPSPGPGQGAKGGPATGQGAAGGMSPGAAAAAGLALASGAASVHLTALMAAIRTIRTHPRTVLLHLPELVDWAMRCIDPANAALRASCIHTVMALLMDLPRTFPMVAFYQSGTAASSAAAARQTGAPGTAVSAAAAAAETAAQSSGASSQGQQLLRLAVGEALNDASKLCIHVYDLSTATKFRVLDASLPAGHPALSSVNAPPPSPRGPSPRPGGARSKRQQQRLGLALAQEWKQRQYRCSARTAAMGAVLR